MKKKKIYFNEDSQKTFQNSKDFEVVFSITIADLKQLILKKDKEITNSDGNKQIQKKKMCKHCNHRLRI